MSPARRWQDVKAEAHSRHPELADPQLRARADAQLDAQVAAFQLGEGRQERRAGPDELTAVSEEAGMYEATATPRRTR